MRSILAPASPDSPLAPRKNSPRKRRHLAAAAAAVLCMAQASTVLAAPPGASNFSINSPSLLLSGGPESTGTINFTVTRSGDTSGTVAVEYTTVQDGNAVPGDDYTAIPPSLLIFAPGVTSQTIPVSVAVGEPAEKAETFGLQLSAGPIDLLGTTAAASFGNYCNQNGIAEGDLNGDGQNDLVLSCGSATTAVQVYFNTTMTPGSTPTFGAPISLTNGGFGTNSVAIADINGDGKMDIVAAGANTTWVYLNQGGGTFSAAFPVPSIGAGAHQSLAVGDLNGDGKPDIATVDGSTDNTVNIALNTTPPGTPDTGTPTFSTPVGVPTGNSFTTSAHGLAIGDLNGDGIPDIAVASFGNDSSPAVNGAVTVFLNLTPAGAAMASFAQPANFPLDHYEYSVAIGNINGGSLPDLAAVSRDGTVTVLGNTTPIGATLPTFATPVDFSVGFGTVAIALGDVSGHGNGQLDIAVSNDFGNIRNSGTLLINNTVPGSTVPSFLLQPLQLSVNGEYGEGEGLVMGDLNQDGLPDLAIPNYSFGNVSVFLDQASFPALISTALGVATLIIPDASGAIGSSGSSGGASSGSAGTGGATPAPATGGGGAADPGLLAAGLGLLLLSRARASRKRGG